MSTVNVVTGCIEEYVGEDNQGRNVYKILYDPKIHNYHVLDNVIFRIKQEAKKELLDQINKTFNF